MRTKWYNGNGNQVSKSPQRLPRSLNDRRAGKDRRGDNPPPNNFPDIAALGQVMVKLGKTLLRKARRP